MTNRCKKKRLNPLDGKIITRISRTVFLLVYFFPVFTGLAQQTPKDTLLHENQESRWSILQEKPIDSLILRRKSNRFSKELHNLIFKKEPSRLENRMTPVINSNLFAYDGKIIRNIEIRSVDIFAGTVFDTAYSAISWLERTGNQLHRDTRHMIIRKNLLLDPGEPLDVFRASENEKIMRDLPYIMDARFLVRNIPGSPDSVDLVLLAQDLWPVGFSAELSDANAGNMGLWNMNMLGFGHRFTTTAFWDGGHKPLFGYQVSYGIYNLWSKFISSELEYINRWDITSYNANITRDFRSTRFKYAGAVRLENTSAIRNITLPDTVLPEVPVEYTNYDFWAGRMIQLKNPGTSYTRSGIYVTSRFFYNNYSQGPVTGEKYLYPFQDKSILLVSGGFSRQGSWRDNLIYTFGRTEDVPFGLHYGLTAGIEWGQYKTRPYIGMEASLGNYLKNRSYIYGLVQYGTFIDGGYFEQSALNIQLRMFSRLYPLNNFRFRNFISLNYLNGINRYAGEFTTLENRGGIIGLTGPSLRGSEKLVLNLESVFFSPFRLVGFRFAFFGSVDIGLIKAETTNNAEWDLFSGLGIGVRMRNDRLVFDTFELKFSLYPGQPADNTSRYINASKVQRLRLNDFLPDQPQIVNYQ